MPEESKDLVPLAKSAVAKAPRNKRELAKLYDRKFIEHAPDLLEDFYANIKKRVAAGDTKALQLLAEVLKLSKGQGVQVNVQQNNNNVTVNPTRDRQADAIIKRLEDRDFLNKKAAAASVVDAEFTDV